MRYPAIAAAFYNTPHAVTPEKLEEVRAYLEGRFQVQPGAWDDDRPEPRSGPRDNFQMIGRVAVVNIFGVIAQRMGMMQALSGGTSAEAIGATIDHLVSDRQVRSIVLNIDSPGGSVFGIQELSDKILKAREEKKIVAVANSMAASAAYWIASAASEINVTPSGQVGSIGVIAAHVDQSKADEAAGVKTTLITAGRYKGELDPSQPLSAEARDNVQQSVDKYYGMFVRGVAKGRGVTENRVDSDYGQGRMKLAKDAVAAGMADHVASLETVLRRLGESEASARSAAASAALRREARARVAEIGA